VKLGGSLRRNRGQGNVVWKRRDPAGASGGGRGGAPWDRVGLGWIVVASLVLALVGWFGGYLVATQIV
jgi:hypothetical protein